MAKSLLNSFRLFHRKIASVLFIFFFIISITGILLGWKSFFTTTIFEHKEKPAAISLTKILPLNTLDSTATQIVNSKTGNGFLTADKLELRPAAGIAVLYYKKNISIQLNAGTALPLLIEQKNGGIIQDIHDGAIVGNLFNNKAGGSVKTVYSSIMGMALLLLTITGFYMWYKPFQIKKQKRTL